MGVLTIPILALPSGNFSLALGFSSAKKIDAASGLEQVTNPGGVAPSIRCGAYGNRPRLAPKRLTGYITGEPTCASGWADLNQTARMQRLGSSR